MNIFIVRTPLLESNMYVIEDEKHAFVIDPYWDDDVSNFLDNLNAGIDFVYLTHEHYDHVSGINSFQERFSSCVFCSGDCANGIADVKKNHTHYFSAFFVLQSKGQRSRTEERVNPMEYHANATFKGRHKTNWRGHDLVFFETPGHSEGSSSLLLDNRLLFCGDSLVQEGNVITRFPGGDIQKFQNITIPLFAKLPRDVIAFPGHGTSFHIGRLEYLND